MILKPIQVRKYHREGYLMIRDVFGKAEIDRINMEMQRVITEDCSRRILEKNGNIRSFFAPEYSSDLFRRVIRSGRLITPAVQLLGGRVYAHQTKINCKLAMGGDSWDWHQDYIFWKKDDGMASPDVVTAMIFLSDVNEFNGPMFLVPRSHKEGIVEVGEKADAGSNSDTWFSSYRKSTNYMSALTADLKYSLGQQAVRKWIDRTGLYSAKGPAGSVLFFHGNIFHASSSNMSPWDRHVFLVTYNRIDNPLPDISNPRPGFIANRDFSELTPLDDEIN